MAVKARPGSKGGIFEFEADLRAFASKIDATVGETTRQTVLAVFRGCREETPVKTGFHKSNWQIQAGSPGLGTLPNGAPPRVQEIKIAVNQKPGGVVWWITNNGPAAKRLEYGWSKKAPNGMVRVTIARVRARMKDIAAAAIRKTGI